MPFPTVETLIHDHAIACEFGGIDAPARAALLSSIKAQCNSEVLDRALTTTVAPEAVLGLFQGSEGALQWSHAVRHQSLRVVVSQRLKADETHGRLAIMREQSVTGSSLFATVARQVASASFEEARARLEMAESSARNAVTSREYSAFVTWLYDAIPQWIAAAKHQQDIRIAAETARQQAQVETQRQEALEVARIKAAEDAREEGLRMLAAQREAAIVREVQIRQLQEQEARLAEELQRKEERDAVVAAEERRLAREAELERLYADETALLQKRIDDRAARLEQLAAEEADILARLEQREAARVAAAAERERRIQELKAAEEAEVERRRVAEDERIREAQRQRAEALQQLKLQEERAKQKLEETRLLQQLKEVEDERRARELHELKIQALKVQEEAAIQRLREARELELRDALAAGETMGRMHHTAAVYADPTVAVVTPQVQQPGYGAPLAMAPRGMYAPEPTHHQPPQQQLQAPDGRYYVATPVYRS